MNKRLVIYSAIVVLIGLLILLWPKSPRDSKEISSERVANSGAAVRSNAVSNSLPAPDRGTLKSVVDFSAEQVKREQERLREMERSQSEWRTPIEFFGKVVDENNMPVQDAEIAFSCNDLSKTGTSDYRARSVASGDFSITGISGKLLTVKVTKEGYYSSRRDNDSFYYAGQNVNFAPDRNHPIIFHLRRKGVAENLAHSSGRIKLPLKGEAVGLELTTGKLVSPTQGDLALACTADYQSNVSGSKFSWNLSLSIQNGGLVESDAEFDVLAPESGYNKSIEIKMPMELENDWKNTIEKKFFVRFANGNYGRFTFLFIAYNGVFRYDSFVNTSGTRNLEYDPSPK